MTDTATRVKKIVTGYLGVSPSLVAESASFTEDLGADSLEIAEMIIAFEEEFDIQIEDDAMDSILTVGDAVKFIEKTKT
ncbi:acyl carrier protein [Agrobacterium sp. B1(2019)]|uniref:acyl carrier protein n=1 Tax=Agrobacterium sp. B1(2019) TaxID=2607032 RepID=UPI0011EF9153|nr:acyl carrier protein [Agrobacterium sp. B1(2019)]TZG33484.1 acyl carrier protein [Agrobacterium sp. B1(2019)]